MPGMPGITMIMHVLMVALPNGWNCRRIEEARRAIGPHLAALGAAEAVPALSTIEAGYCECERSEWARYRLAYLRNAGQP